jgi:hypothetical protein
MNHTGHCHCKAVEYTVEMDLDTASVIECNCSHCGIKSLLLAFVPASSFSLVRGAESLTEYQFNKHVIAHMSCKVCGVEPFAYGEKGDEKMVAINVRTLDDIDLSTIKRMPYDGKSV